MGAIYIPVKDKDGKIVGGVVIGLPEVKGGAINDLANKDPQSPDLDQEDSKEEKSQNTNNEKPNENEEEEPNE